MTELSIRQRIWLIIGAVLVLVTLLAACGTEKSVATGGTQKGSTTQARTVTIPIQGMSCGACAAGVKKKLKAVKGVQEVEVNLEHRHARVRYTDGQVPPQSLVAAINELGYKAGKPAAEIP